MIDVKIEFCTFFEDRKQFQYGEETYSQLTLFCVESGSFEYWMGDGERYTVGRGQVVVCPVGVALHRVMREPSSFGMIRVTPSVPVNFGEAPVNPRELSRFFFDLEALHRCRFRHDFSDGQADEHYCRDIWYLLQSTEERVSPIERAYRHICRYYTESLSVEALAKEAGYSTVHFINCFRGRYGLTPRAQITRLRMLRAKELLENTTLPVCRIAFDVGYGDEFYFSRLFRRQVGMSPREFRVSAAQR